MIPAGRVLGHWRIVRPLGEGSFGAVYEAENIAIAGRRAAVKVLHGRGALRASVKRRFVNEASAASRADHENIVHVYDGGVAADGTCYLVMELLRGTPLSRLLDGRPLGAARSVNLALQIASALHAAHHIGIVHRDLKPENIFVVRRSSQPEFVKVLDFGVAKLRGDLAGSLRTDAGAWMGTPRYMSPEQWHSLADIDGRADVYALGLILFECLAGEATFAADTQYGLMLAHLEQPVPLIADPALPVALTDLVRLMLAKRREERPQTMLEVIEALRAIRGDPMSEAEIAAAATVADEGRAPAGLLVGGGEGDTPDLAAMGGEAPAVPAPSTGDEVRTLLSRARRERASILAALVTAAGALVTLALAVAHPGRARMSAPASPPAAVAEPAPRPALPPLPGELVPLGPGTLAIGWGARGDRLDGPAHAVTLGRFAIGRYEVRMAELKEFAVAVGLPPPLPWDGVDDFAAIRELPVNLVNQYDAARYCAWRYARWGGRLPTEEEWEFAARDGDERRRFPWPGDRFDGARVNAGRKAALDAVTANAGGATDHGVFNLIGNVAEWTASPAWLYPGSAANVVPHGVVVRGGSLRSIDPELLTATGRAFVAPDRRDPLIGFRCAASAD